MSLPKTQNKTKDSSTAPHKHSGATSSRRPLSKQPKFRSYRFSVPASSIRTTTNWPIHVTHTDQNRVTTTEFLVQTSRIDDNGPLNHLTSLSIWHSETQHSHLANVLWSPGSPRIQRYGSQALIEPRQSMFPDVPDPHANNHLVGYGSYFGDALIWYPQQGAGCWNLHSKRKDGSLTPGELIGRVYTDIGGGTIFEYYRDLPGLAENYILGIIVISNIPYC